jgi:hypothetical protein
VATRFAASVRALARPGRLIERSANQLDRAVARHSSEAAHKAILRLTAGLAELQRVDDASTRVAKRYGFHDCAKSGDRDRQLPTEPAPGGVQA